MDGAWQSGNDSVSGRGNGGSNGGGNSGGVGAAADASNGVGHVGVGFDVRGAPCWWLASLPTALSPSFWSAAVNAPRSAARTTSRAGGSRSCFQYNAACWKLLRRAGR
eukprot:TRINITY_DN13465_c0_g1_i1.p3 TRINITY_DN13465_c0_g1~~TRINITY_DN13465_c0_g1_i1.p3  ORF type:complete len:108 (+),score=18.64 TRINITY_DN13465_c0_g1_i1:92-415(+)